MTVTHDKMALYQGIFMSYHELWDNRCWYEY